MPKKFSRGFFTGCVLIVLVPMFIGDMLPNIEKDGLVIISIVNLLLGIIFAFVYGLINEGFFKKTGAIISDGNIASFVFGVLTTFLLAFFPLAVMIAWVY